MVNQCVLGKYCFIFSLTKTFSQVAKEQLRSKSRNVHMHDVGLVLRASVVSVST